MPVDRFVPAKERTLGVKSRLSHEWQIPAGLYYPFQWAMELRAWPVQTATGVLALFWISQTGSLLIGIGLALGTMYLGLTGWVGWRRRSTHEVGAEPPTIRTLLAEQKILRNLRKQWVRACGALNLLEAERRTPPRLYDLKAAGSSQFTATVAPGAGGPSVERITKNSAELASLLGYAALDVRRTTAGKATIRMYRQDVLADLLPLSRMPIAESGRIAYGIRLDGSPASIPQNQSLLVGGKSRHGKSTIIWALLADVARQRLPIDLYISDCKEGLELRALGQRLGQNTGTLRVMGYAVNEDDSIKMIAEVNQLRIARMQAMAARGARVHTPTVEEPLIVVLIDELLPFQDSILKQGTKSPLGRIGYAGAAAGVLFWANTQLGEKAVLGAIRDIIQSRVSVATPNRENTDMILGSNATADGADCTVLQGKPGRGFSYEDGDLQAVYRPFRAAMVTDTEAELIAQGLVPEGMPMSSDGDETPIWEAFDADGKLLWRGTDRPTMQSWWGQVTTTRPTWCPSRAKALEIIAKLNKSHPPHYLKTSKPERTLATSLEDLRRLVRR